MLVLALPVCTMVILNLILKMFKVWYQEPIFKAGTKLLLKMMNGAPSAHGMGT
jgi:hypothetical protein